jgi:hypothetical protein
MIPGAATTNQPKEKRRNEKRREKGHKGKRGGDLEDVRRMVPPETDPPSQPPNNADEQEMGGSVSLTKQSRSWDPRA